MDNHLSEGISALKAGDREAARRFLAQALRADPNSERAWQWMYNASENDAKRRKCLEQILRINPANQKAAQMLAQIDGSTVVETTKNTPIVSKTTDSIQPKNVLIGIGIVLFLCITCLCIIFSLPGKTEKNYKTAAYVECMVYVENMLKSPSTAKFPGSSDSDIRELDNKVFEIRSYVDAQNSFGAMIRNNFYCKVQFLGDDKSDEYDSRYWYLLELDIFE